jgi:hypothetical protein
MSTSKEAATLVVITFLVVILIYSSVAKFEVFARPRSPVTATNCVVVKPDKPGAVYAERCCDTTTHFNDQGQVTFSETLCQVCQYAGGGSKIDCSSVSHPPPITGGLNPPPSVGAEQPPPPPASTLRPPPSTSSEQPPTTATCPDGSAPDANGNCPTSTTNQQIAPPSSTSTEQHHNKGSNLLGGQGLTTKKGNNNDNSPTPPACPTDNSPIPPNCTLKPKF